MPLQALTPAQYLRCALSPANQQTCAPQLAHRHSYPFCLLLISCRSDLASLYNEEGRRLVSDAVCAELIAAAAEGPRASDRFAAVTATAVAGLAGSVRSAEIVANFIDRLAAAFVLAYKV